MQAAEPRRRRWAGGLRTPRAPGPEVGVGSSFRSPSLGHPERTREEPTLRNFCPLGERRHSAERRGFQAKLSFRSAFEAPSHMRAERR